MRTDNGPLPMLVGGVLVATVICTVLVTGGWLFWIPVALALAVVACLASTKSH